MVNSLVFDRVPGGFDPALVDDVIFGCVSQVGERIGASVSTRAPSPWLFFVKAFFLWHEFKSLGVGGKGAEESRVRAFA